MTASEKLRQERAKLIEDMRALNAKAEADNRDLNTEEKASYDKMLADAGSLRERYERMENEEKLVRDLSQSRAITDPANGRSASESKSADPLASPEYAEAFRKYVRTGDKRVFRDLNTTTPADGGYIVPVTIANEIVKELINGSTVRRAGARVLATGTRTTIPFSNIPTPTWEPERDPYGNNADTDPTIGAFAAAPRKLTARTTISEELLFDATLNIDGYVKGLFTDAFAQSADNGYVNGAGSGSNQPNGVFSGGTDKVVTSATTFTAAELVAHFHALPAKYRNSRNCAWIASDKFIGLAAAMATNPANGVVFSYSTVAGEPDKLFNKPIYSSPAVDTNYAANAEVAVIADFSFYQIVDFTNYTAIVRLNELSALTGAVQYVARIATDGKLLVADAARILKLASS